MHACSVQTAHRSPSPAARRARGFFATACWAPILSPKSNFAPAFRRGSRRGYTTTPSRDGQSYTGMMVGLSPMSSPNSTTTIPTQIVPLILIMPDGGTFDPTAPDPCAAAPLTGTSDLTLVEQSPIFLSHAYTMNGVNVGTTQSWRRASALPSPLGLQAGVGILDCSRILTRLTSL